MQSIYNQPDVSLTYTNGGLDCYGRIINHSWVKNTNPLVHIIHSYDYNGNRTKRHDSVHAANSELYTYDNLGQIKTLNRGILNADHTSIPTVNHSESWNFDKTGNWSQYTKNGNTENRTHNTANELQGIATHDANGNMVLMPGLKGKYDAWNRLVEVRDSNDNLIAQYEYNGLNQRIKKTVGSTVTKSFFNEKWQEVESITNNHVTSYVWGLRYIDDLILREKGEERLYSLADPNWNVIAICDANGDIQERYTYDAFGNRNVFDTNFTLKSDTEFNWNRAFTGQALDIETGLMLYRERYYCTKLGRFVRRDPIMYTTEDMNVYRYVKNFPKMAKDQYGLDITLETGNDTSSPLNNAVHQNICVDVWTGCNTNNPKKMGKRCFSFGMCSGLEGLGVWSGSTWLGMDSCKACILTGNIYEADPVDTADTSRLKKTTCQEDKAFLEKLKSLEGTKDGYSVANHNCRRFSQCMFEQAPGIEMKWVCLEYEYICYASSGGFAGCTKVCKRGEWQAVN